MKLLKIIGVIFLIYFIRRFIQMYKVMARIQREQEELRRHQNHGPVYQEQPKKQAGQEDVIEADFKVLNK